MRRRDILLAVIGLTAACSRRDQTLSGPPSDFGASNPSQPVRPVATTPKDEMEFAYAVEIPDSNNTPVTVQDTFRFRSGERFRVQWKANFTGYVYVFNRGPRSEYYARLVPARDEAAIIGASMDLAARIPKGLPEWLRFDGAHGEEQMILVVSRSPVPVLERRAARYSVDEFDRILIALERSRRPRSMRRFDEGNWHKCVAAGADPNLTVVNRLPLYHE